MRSFPYAVDAVVVAGAGGALGQAVVRYLLDAGRRVHAVYRRHVSVPSHPRLTTHTCDLGDGKAVQELFAHLAARHADVAAVVNAAGGFVGAKTAACADEDLDFLLTANYKSAFFLTKYALPHLCAQRAGRIVLISAAATWRGGEIGMGAYLASKAALNALLASTALELRGSRVTINAVAPTIIDTPSNRRALPQADTSTWVSTTALNRVISLLLSEQGGDINGALIPVL